MVIHFIIKLDTQYNFQIVGPGTIQYDNQTYNISIDINTYIHKHVCVILKYVFNTN